MRRVSEAEATIMTARQFEAALVRSGSFSEAAAKAIASRLDAEARAFAGVEQKASGFILGGMGEVRHRASRRVSWILEDLWAAAESLRRQG